MKKACKYTMVGCNEPQIPGGLFLGGCISNGLKSVEQTIYKRENDIVNTKTFDEFYNIFEQELFDFLDNALSYHDKFQMIRARDKNFVGSMFYDGVIENAMSITEGGCTSCIPSLGILGISNIVDSLTVIKQFVFDKKIISMSELVSALKSNWQGYEVLRTTILNKTEFFGNNSDISNCIADKYATSVNNHLKNKRNCFGYKFLTGNLIGYNQHNKWFGEKTKATPDGRFYGDIINFGIGQTDGKDRKGITALLDSVSKLNKHTILCGGTVTNILLDEELIKNDANFEMTVKLFETYLQNGGLHFQLTYVSKEDLIAAQSNPEKYNNLRVRVSGFSDYFTRLNKDLQDEIIERTKHT